MAMSWVITNTSYIKQDICAHGHAMGYNQHRISVHMAMPWVITNTSYLKQDICAHGHAMGYNGLLLLLGAIPDIQLYTPKTKCSLVRLAFI